VLPEDVLMARDDFMAQIIVEVFSLIHSGQVKDIKGPFLTKSSIRMDFRMSTFQTFSTF
jgi:hypothetical protein